MQEYKTETREYIPKKYGTECLPPEDRISKGLIEELQLAPSKIPGLEGKVYMSGDCGSCPDCACITQEVQFLAVIEAPAATALMVAVLGIRVSS